MRRAACQKLGGSCLFLNELDGFAGNTRVVVLASTNHPERLDPALLDRPSRFDRKYTFELPAPAERAAYVSAWNAKLEADARLSDGGVAAVVEQTEGYSFAYLKELYVSSLTEWVAEGAEADLTAVVLARGDTSRTDGGAPRKTE